MKKNTVFQLIFIISLLFLILIAGCNQQPAIPGSSVENTEITHEASTETQASENSKEIETNTTEVSSEENLMVTDVQIETESTVQATTEETTTEQFNVETTTEASYESDESTENQLKIEGLVENVLSLGLDELKNMQDIIYSGTFYSLNSYGTTEYTDFKGINLWLLLNEKAILPSEAQKISIIAIDGYKVEFSIDQVKKQDYIDETNPNLQLPMIIAWEENGIEYNPNDGPPFKLVVGQKEEGDINKPQWIRDIDKIIVE